MFGIILSFLKLYLGGYKGIEPLIFLLFFIGLCSLVSSWYLLKGTKWSLITLLIILFIIVFGGASLLFMGFMFGFTHGWSIKDTLADILPTFVIFDLFLIPLILLCLDRKNFWKIVS